MSKMLILNSGGFDSIVMTHYLLDKEDYGNYKVEEAELLFFNWGQPNYFQEKDCVHRCAKKLGVKLKTINIDYIDTWGDVSMDKEPYIPMRNLVFISHEVAYAQKYGYDTIAMALIDNEVEENPYYDCSQEFIDRLNAVLKNLGIQIITPFIDTTKPSLCAWARHYNIKRNDSLSCNTPKHGKRCEECNDCITLKTMYDEWIDTMQFKDPLDKDYKDRFMNNPIHEMRLLINNACQFKCNHCFYGFDKTVDDNLTTEELKQVIAQAHILDINHVHISGKEPLVNDKVFELTKYMDGLNMTYDIVTNGVNIEKYIKQLTECKGLNKILLSVDSLTKDVTLRDSNAHVLRNIALLQEHKLTLEVDVDLYKGNLPTYAETLEVLKEHGVNFVYTRAVLPLGNAEKNELDLLDCNDWADLLSSAILGKFPVDIEFCIAKDYYWNATNDDLKPYLDYIENFGITKIGDHVEVCLEKYCNSFLGQITVTSDGYVLGCGSQVSYPKYNEISPGSVRHDTLKNLIMKGKEQHLAKFQNIDKFRCFFHKL